MSRSGKPKDKKGKGLPGDREEETRFIERGADTGQKTGHGKSRGATAVPRGGRGPIETSSSTDHGASGEVDQLKKKKKTKTSSSFKLPKGLGFGKSSSHSPKPSSKENVQSPTSSLATVGGASKQSEETEVCRRSLKTVLVFVHAISDPSLPSNDCSC